MKIKTLEISIASHILSHRQVASANITRQSNLATCRRLQAHFCLFSNAESGLNGDQFIFNI